MAQIENTPLKRRSIFDSAGNKLTSSSMGDKNPIDIRLLDIQDTITEVVSNALSYTGYTTSIGANTTDSVWYIKRTRRIGTLTYVNWASGGAGTNQWALRTTYFDDPGLLNGVSLLFDGNNDYVSFGNAFNYDASNAWSFSAWLKLDNIAAQRQIYSKATADANVYGWNFAITTGGLVQVQARAAGTLTATTFAIIVPVGSWFHFVFTYAGGSNTNGMRVYIDNVVDSVPGSSAINSLLASQTAMIGTRNGGFPWSGKMDEVSLWDKALSASEVSDLYNSGVPSMLSQESFAGNLDHWYPFDGDTSPTILDAIGSVNGTMINMAGSASFSGDVP